MNIFKTVSTAALLLTSLSTVAITFQSDGNDGCTACVLSNDNWPTYVDPDSTTELVGAQWVQANDSWDVAADYSVFELDLYNSTFESTLTSLFVAYDDTLAIKIGDELLFDSEDAEYGITYNGWQAVTDVFSFIDPMFIAAGQTLDFYVTNTGLPNAVYGPSGVVWKGTVEVPEPSVVFALGLGIAAFGFTRRKNKNL